MTSLILQTATRLLHPLMLFVSVVLFFRGHNQPGGGFVGGLVAAAAYGLYAMAFGLPATRIALRIDPRSLIGCGLLVAIATATAPLLFGAPFFDGAWVSVPLSDSSFHVGSPLLFDLGVYLVVAGAALATLFALEEG